MRRLVTVVLCAIALAPVACGDGDGDSVSTLTPTGAAAATDTSARAAAAPQLPANATLLSDGRLQISVPPDEPALLDPSQLAAADDIEPPACAGFVFATSWLVTSAIAGADAALIVSALRQGSVAVIGQGPAGAATTGCDILQFENGTARPLTIELRYLIASLE